MSSTFNISGRHVEITPAIDSYVKSKMERVTRIFANRVTTIHVILSVEKIVQKAEAEIKIPGDKNIIFAEASSEDMYQSIDKLEDRLYTQVKKYHDKLTDHEKRK